MALDEVLQALLDGLRDGDHRALKIYFRSAGLVPGRFDLGALAAYPARWAWQVSRKGKTRTMLALEDAGRKVRDLNPRCRDYIRRAARIVGMGRRRFGLTETDAEALMTEASAARWRAKNGLEYRFLAALVQAPEVLPEATVELRPEDFMSFAYAALFEQFRRRGPAALEESRPLLAGRGHIPILDPAWWAAEARGTLAELLARRARVGLGSNPARSAHHYGSRARSQPTAACNRLPTH